MMIECPDCGRPTSDKAPFCLICHYNIDWANKRENAKQTVRIITPAGIAMVTRIEGMKSPYRVKVPALKAFDGKQTLMVLKPRGYYKTYEEAYEAATDVTMNPYINSKDMTLEELYIKWTRMYSQISLMTEVLRDAWSHCESIKDMKVCDIRKRHINQCLLISGTGDNRKGISNLIGLLFMYASESGLVNDISFRKGECKSHRFIRLEGKE